MEARCVVSDSAPKNPLQDPNIIAEFRFMAGEEVASWLPAFEAGAGSPELYATAKCWYGRFLAFDFALLSQWNTLKTKMVSYDWTRPLPNTSFDAAGLIALADLDTIARRTILTGTAVYLDALVLCPGIHRQQTASELNRGELPPTAAMTTGYVFRVENQATVAYLQSISKTGHLTTLTAESEGKSGLRTLWNALFGPGDSLFAFLLLTTIRLLTIFSIVFLAIIQDWWGFAILLSLMLARVFNIYIVRRRTRPGWHGISEPGVKGDLLVLLSQDRWVRLQGPVDALKAATSGQFLVDMNFFEGSLNALATLFVYLSAALASNATQVGKLLFIALLLISVCLLAISNHPSKYLHMHGTVLKPNPEPKAYERRLGLAKKLMRETKRDDWAIGLGMVKPEDAKVLMSSPVIL